MLELEEGGYVVGGRGFDLVLLLPLTVLGGHLIVLRRREIERRAACRGDRGAGRQREFRGEGGQVRCFFQVEGDFLIFDNRVPVQHVVRKRAAFDIGFRIQRFFPDTRDTGCAGKQQGDCKNFQFHIVSTWE